MDILNSFLSFNTYKTRYLFELIKKCLKYTGNKIKTDQLF